MNERMIVVPNNVPAIRARTVRARPASESWNAQAIEDIKSTPDKPNPKNENQRIIESERNTEGLEFGAKSGHDIAVQDEERIKHVRDFRITDTFLTEFGYTPDCVGCDAKRHGAAKRAHSTECRTRIENEILAKYPESPALQQRLDRHVAWSESIAKAQLAQKQAAPAGMRRASE